MKPSSSPGARLSSPRWTERPRKNLRRNMMSILPAAEKALHKFLGTLKAFAGAALGKGWLSAKALLLPAPSPQEHYRRLNSQVRA